MSQSIKKLYEDVSRASDYLDALCIMLQLNEEAALQEVDLLKIKHAANEIAQVMSPLIGPELHEMVEANAHPDF
tara:strand:- start:65 stop:286 length:222 start_codon:yes stop_codon:yes gene_type:complete